MTVHALPGAKDGTEGTVIAFRLRRVRKLTFLDATYRCDSVDEAAGMVAMVATQAKDAVRQSQDLSLDITNERDAVVLRASFPTKSWEEGKVKRAIAMLLHSVAIGLNAYDLIGASGGSVRFSPMPPPMSTPKAPASPRPPKKPRSSHLRPVR